MQINMFCLAPLIHLRYCVCSISLSKPSRMQANDRADRLAGKAATTSRLRLGIFEVLKTWRRCLQAQSQGISEVLKTWRRCLQAQSQGISEVLKTWRRCLQAQSQGISEVLKTWRRCLQAQSQGHRSPEEGRSRKKKRSTIFSFSERRRDGRRQSDEHCKRFKRQRWGNFSETCWSA